MTGSPAVSLGFVISFALVASVVALPASAQTPPAPAPAAPPSDGAPPAPPGAVEAPVVDVAKAPLTPAAAAPAPASAPVVLPPPPAPAPVPFEAPPADVKPKKSGEASKLKVTSENGQHSLEFHGLVDADGRFFLTDKGGIGTFVVRRARPTLDAKLFRYFELNLTPELAGSKLAILEAFANFHLWDAFQLRVGKGKSPVGLERLQSSKDTLFAETALPTQLVPNRDVGAMVHGKIADGTLEYQLGVFNGVPNGQMGDTDTNDSKDVEGRVFVHPFMPTDIEALRGLGLGIAGTTGNEEGAALPGYVTSGQTAFFTYAPVVNGLGRRTLVSPQAYYYGGPVAALFELVRVEDHLASPTGAKGTVGTTAWAVQAGVVLGGKETWKGVKVDHPLDPEKGGFGAFEVGARYGDLRVGDLAYERGFASRKTSAARATQWGIEGTWHVADGDHFRVSYERTDFRGGAASGNRKPELLLLARTQVAF